MHTFVFVRDVVGAAFWCNGHALDAREARELADELGSEGAGEGVLGKYEVEVSFGCRLSSIWKSSSLPAIGQLLLQDMPRYYAPTTRKLL
jgi:hypothetical protein